MSFKPKPLKLNWDQELPKYYFDNSPFKTHLFNSISILFRYGEPFFIDSVKNYRNHITDLALLEDVDNFIKQEIGHSVTHKNYDAWLISQGLPIEYLENILLNNLEKIKKLLGTKGCLITTTVFEHVTAIAAEYVLLNPSVMEKMHPHFKKIWEHHSIEEIEHKAVATDVLNTIGVNKVRRIVSSIIWGIIFITVILRNTIILLHADKQLWKWRTVKDAANLLFNYRDGIVTSLLLPWIRCLKINFHPNDHDTTLLLQRFSKV
jgi:hypothetical protein